jgi:hypothetical protein
MAEKEAAKSEDVKRAALESFEKWSNYLLVATVAAAGWIASKNAAFTSGNLRSAALWCFGLSIIFGIFTLAMVPLIAQTMKEESSIYRVQVTYHVFGFECRSYLTQACRPQHLTFIVGILFYCIGTGENLWIGGVVVVATAVYAYYSKRAERVPSPAGE